MAQEYFTVIDACDGSFVLTNLYNIDKVEFGWRSSDKSKWPTHDIEFHDNDTSMLRKGIVKFIGCYSDAEFEYDLLKNSNVNIQSSISLLDELEAVKSQAKEMKSELAQQKKRIDQLEAELRYLKTIFCPQNPNNAITVGRHLTVVNKHDLDSAIEESTDLKGFTLLAQLALNFNVEDKDVAGKTWRLLDKVDRAKLEDLMSRFLEKKIEHEISNPKPMMPLPKKRARASKRAELGEEAQPKKRNREEIDESTLPFAARKKRLHERFGKKLSNSKPKIDKTED